jgi:hypothetical protein
MEKKRSSRKEDNGREGVGVKRKNNPKTFCTFYLREGKSFTIKSRLTSLGTSKKAT